MKKYTVDFGKVGRSDESQNVILRLLEKDHPVLYGEQGHFEAYVKVASKNLSKNVPMWDKRKAEKDVWENQDVTPSKKIAGDGGGIDAILNDGKILNKKEKKYLAFYFAGNVNEAICSKMGISERSGKYIKKKIISKLKTWSMREALKSAIQSDPGMLHSSDISDLRYRVIPLSISDRAENDEQILNSTMPVKSIQVGADYCPLRQRYSGKITAPVVGYSAGGAGAKTFWPLPSQLSDINQAFDIHGIAPTVTVGAYKLI